MIDLYCLGGASIDLVLDVPRHPLEGEKLLAQYYGQLPGGFIANTACAAARLGLNAAWGGQVGDDAFGQRISESFQEFGVSIEDVKPHKNSSSNFTVILIQPDGERTILVVTILPTPPPLNEGMRNSLSSTRIGYTALYEYDWYMEVAGLLHDGGGKSAVDLEKNTLQDIDVAKRMLKATDIIFSDEDALQKLTGNGNVEESVKEILSFGPEVIVLTKGGDGADAFTANEKYSTGTYEVPIKDTTGAGDCFHAAFLYGMISDFDFQSCLDFASAASAILIQQVGARRGLPSAAEVRKFIEKHDKEKNCNELHG